MKIKTFTAVSLAIIIVSSVIITFVPYIGLSSARTGLLDKPSSGKSFLTYEFTDGGIYYYKDNIPALLRQTGILNLSLNGSGVEIHLAIKGPKLNSSMEGSVYRQSFETELTSKLDTGFIYNFLNEFPRNQGDIVSMDNQTGINAPQLSYPFSVQFTGTNNTLKHISTAIGYTDPFVVYFPDFKMKSNPGLPPYENYYLYDWAGGTNILVQASLLAGTTGIDSFLHQLLDNTSFGLPVLNVTTFNLNLINTNIALQPVDMSHYLLQFVSIVLIITVLGVSYVALTVRIVKNRAEKAKVTKWGKK